MLSWIVFTAFSVGAGMLGLHFEEKRKTEWAALCIMACTVCGMCAGIHMSRIIQ